MKDLCSTPRQLATRWVWYLEFGLLPASPHHTQQVRAILARELDQQNKNPEHWSDEEVEGFLMDLIGPAPIGDLFMPNPASFEPRKTHLV